MSILTKTKPAPDPAATAAALLAEYNGLGLHHPRRGELWQQLQAAVGAAADAARVEGEQEERQRIEALAGEADDLASTLAANRQRQQKLRAEAADLLARAARLKSEAANLDTTNRQLTRRQWQVQAKCRDAGVDLGDEETWQAAIKAAGERAQAEARARFNLA